MVAGVGVTVAGVAVPAAVVSAPVVEATLEAVAPLGGGEYEPLVAFLQTSLDGPGRQPQSPARGRCTPPV